MPSRPKQPIPFSPRVVPDPGPRGIVSPSIGGGGATVRLDANAAMAPAQGMADMGQGIAKAGTAAYDLAEKIREARSITGQYKAAEIMGQAQADIATATAAEQDAKKWGGIMEQYLGEADKQLQALDLDPQTRELVNHKAVMNRADVQKGLGEQAIRKDFRDARTAISNTLTIAGKTNNTDLFNSTVATATAGPHPLMTPEEKQLARIEFDETVKANNDKLKKEQILSTVRQHDDPNKLAEEWQKNPPKGYSEEQIAWGINRAQEAGREQAYATTKELNGHVESGEFVVPEQVDEYRKTHPKVTDEQANNAKAGIHAATKADHQQWVESNVDTNMSAVMARIRAYDRDKDPEYKEWNFLESWIDRNLPEGPRGNASAALKSRLAGKAAKETDPQMEWISNELDNMFKAEAFGKYKTPTLVLLEQGDRTSQRTVEIENPIDKARAEDARVRIEAEMRGWVKANPKATETEKMKRIFEIMPKAKAVAFIDNFRPFHSRKQEPGVIGPSQPVEHGLPKYEGRAPKAQPVDEEEKAAPTSSGPPDYTDPDYVPKDIGSTTAGDAAGDLPSSPASLFPPAGSGNILMDKSLPDLSGQTAGDLPEERKKKKKR